ncbi:MAG: hypothetical protein QOG46_2911, partial [Pseudonocardiales bacterium]|nr:hypothetical protein [Pseudonocardiales bacterium]
MAVVFSRMRDKVTGTLLGGCQLRRQANGSAEVSYWTAAPHRGRGLAQRALETRYRSSMRRAPSCSA